MPSSLMDHERNAGQSEMEVGRPATTHAFDFHRVQTAGIDKRQIPIAETTQQRGCGLDFARPRGEHGERSHRLDHGEKLQGLDPVVAFQKPAVAFRNDEGRRDQHGGSENSRRNNGCQLSDRSANAMSAEVST